jgi:hypothetical protein
MKEFRFYKEVTHRWYVDLPEWEGPKAALEMVDGADTMLEYMAEGLGEVRAILSTKKVDNSYHLHFIRETPEVGEGAQYYLEEYIGLTINLKVWLCDVTKFVFGDFPKDIWITPIN